MTIGPEKMRYSEERQQLAEELGNLLTQASNLEDDGETVSKIEAAQKQLAEARDESTWEQLKATLDSTVVEIRKGLAAYGE